ncbi:meiotic expression up-regulated 26 [Fusarium sporotrichioides]|uniref:Meiotic expression up-regulated 26 n=1 Tax=Fusarium sporotrichioides TaxID=5514 RepID=A0A395SSX3_FUSSP|nr:meiotic expression up-regulated 26 [Fusarium sporotrichioides]
MNHNEFTETESMMGSDEMWSTPVTQSKPRPMPIYQGLSFCGAEDFSSVPSWDTSSVSFQQTPSETMSRPVSMHQDFYPPTMDNASWMDKPTEDHFDLHGMDYDMTMGMGNSFTADEAIPVLDLKHGTLVEEDLMAIDGGSKQRRMSGSSFSMSTSGAFSDMHHDDFSAALSEAPSFTSDYPPRSNRTSMMSSTQLSPVASPRMTPQSRTDLVRTQSRGRGASPSPRPVNVRSAPYSVEGPRIKRWSTGTYGTPASRKPAQYAYHPCQDVYNNHQQMFSGHSSPAIGASPLPLNYGNLQAMQQAPFVVPSTPVFQRNSMLLPTQLPSQMAQQQQWQTDVNHYAPPQPLLSHGLFRMLQSNGDASCLSGHYTDLSDPPDLYAALQEEQIPPPPEDMNPEDPDMIPREQELRFEGDLYTPRWVRGHGNKREGWCGICKPGRWLVLKNSAFWYDKSFSHGISAATGSSFQEPQQKRRMDGNPDVWEGLCGSCNEWIALVSSKKKGTTWFRHAYKCHTHLKVKDTPKRRRESSNARALAMSSMAKPKTDAQRPITPQMPGSSMETATTPRPSTMSHITSHPQSHHHLLTPQEPYTIDPMSGNVLVTTEPFPNMI